MKIEEISPDRFKIGEGGFWDTRSDSLLFVDVYGPAVLRYQPDTSRLHRIDTAQEVHFAIPRSNGQGLVITQGPDLVLLEEKSGKTTPFVSGAALGLPEGAVINDAKCDVNGRLWLGTYKAGGELSERDKWEPLGGIYRVCADGSVSQQADKMTLSNGLDWTSDNRTMIFADSFAAKVYAFDFDLDSGQLSNQRVCLQWDKGGKALPDGLCFDTTDKAWVAMFGVGRVAQFDIETGQELQSISFPCEPITCANFGGKEWSDLYVTSSAIQDRHNSPAAGATFKVTGLNAKGRAPNLFAG